MTAVASPSISFDEATHTYTDALGRKVPGVTTILKPITSEAYRFVDPALMETAAKLGQRVHRVIELDNENDLDEESLAADLVPYLASWRQFRAQSGFELAGSEVRVHSATHGYAGTLDLVGKLKGRLCIIDAKRTAAVPRSAAPQTAAYAEAWREMTGTSRLERIERFALHLYPKGWSLVPFRDAGDFRLFLSLLNVHNFMHGAKP